MFDNYIALDWAQSNMAIARMTAKSKNIGVKDTPADLGNLKAYLKSLKGTKILTFEESTTAQWLYTELHDQVDEILVCDPRRNHLLAEGPKTDKIDAMKLVKLLRADLLKPVFHTTDEFVHIRKICSGYEDVVKAGVRLKNQRAALFRGVGRAKGERALKGKAATFVLAGLDNGIAAYKEEKVRYEDEFNRIAKSNKLIQNLKSVPGIGIIGAVKVAAIVVDPRRFESRNAFISYCGLIKHERISGGRSYGKKAPAYNRSMKSVFKTAAVTATIERTNSVFAEYYEYLQKGKNYAEHNARNALARRIATLAWGVMKSGKRFDTRRLNLEKTT